MCDCCGSSAPQSSFSSAPAGVAPLDWFARMIPNCLDYAREAQRQWRPIVGIMCEYTPRELIMAAGAVPVCLCGGSAKTIPAAEEFLPAGLCPLIKSTFGYHVLASNPFLEMASLVVAETTCDGKKKMFELLGEKRPMHVLELPQKPDDPDAREHWLREMRKLRAALEERFSTQITDCRLREAIRLMNRERRLRRDLAALMQADAPPLTGRQLLSLKSSISGIPADLEQYERALAEFTAARPDPAQAQFNQACSNISSPACSGISNPACSGGFSPGGTAECSPPFQGWVGDPENHQSPVGTTEASSCLRSAPPVPALARRVRVLLTGVPLPAGAERVLDLIESRGGLVVCQENCTGLKPILEDVDEQAADPLAALADKYFHLPCSVMTPNAARFDLLEQLAAQYRPQCIIELVWQGCLTYAVEAQRTRRLAEERLGLPYLRIETDYSPGDSERIAVRIEALFETVRSAI